MVAGVGVAIASIDRSVSVRSVGRCHGAKIRSGKMPNTIPSIEFFDGISEELENVSLRRNP
jgi:hypothetical protein